VTLQEELREAAPHAAVAEDMDLLMRAADRLEQAQSLAEERLESIGHWKAALEETVRERDEARAELSRCNDRLAELKAALDFQRESYGGAAGDAFDAIAKLCGCEQWDYPGQLVRDVERMNAERDGQARRIDQLTRSATIALDDEETARAELATALQQCANVAAAFPRCYFGECQKAAIWMAGNNWVCEDHESRLQGEDETQEVPWLLALERAGELATPSAQESSATWDPVGGRPIDPDVLAAAVASPERGTGGDCGHCEGEGFEEAELEQGRYLSQPCRHCDGTGKSLHNATKGDTCVCGQPHCQKCGEP
jgi:hypothetical protein